jgi:vesicle-fusing ATPase
LIFATTSQRNTLNQLQLVFNAQINVGEVMTQGELAMVLSQSGLFSDRDIQHTISDIEGRTNSTAIGVGIKTVLESIRTAKQDDNVGERFSQILSAAINDRKAFAV